MKNVLINTDKYNGLYVAMKSFDDHTIIGTGIDPRKALKDAEKKGIKDPVILYVPEEEVIHIYPVNCQ